MAGQLSIGSHGIFPDVFALFAIKDVFQAETLSGAISLSAAYPSITKLNPGGAHRNVTLEAETAAHHGKLRWIINSATAAENLDFAIGRSDRSWMLLVTHDSEPTVYLHDSLRAAKDDAESVAVELLG